MPSEASKHLPSVTAIMPAKNEEGTIEVAIESLLTQEYLGSLDIVVAIAPSTDLTVEVTARIAANNARLSIVENPRGTTPAGLNAAVAASTGDIIVRCDAHSEMPRGYVSGAVRTLVATGAVNVGGVQEAIGIEPMQRTIAAAMSSPFGVGDARFHMGGSPGFVDTVYLGVFQRDALEAAGGFDETLVRNQDYELNYRLRERGGGIYFDPALKVTYRPRTSLRGLWLQYFDYGRWTRVVIKRHPRSARWRQFAAPAFIVGLVLSGTALAFGFPLAASVVPGAYLVTSVAATLYELVKRRDFALLLLPAAFVTMHVAWGLGFLLSRYGKTRDR
jgi:glycosyltransferase involved in cell wall biosynthesis